MRKDVNNRAIPLPCASCEGRSTGVCGALDCDQLVELAKASRAQGMKIMVGCMLATSLAMAPTFLVAQLADYVDLDGPLLLAKDRAPGITYQGSLMLPPPAALWG